MTRPLRRAVPVPARWRDGWRWTAEEARALRPGPTIWGLERDAAALAPAELALALETIWLLCVVGVVSNPDRDARFVDIVLRPDMTGALDLAVAAADALDLLRGSGVVDAFRRRQMELVDMMAIAAADPMARVAGTA